MGSEGKKFKRKCIICSKIRDKSDLLRITINSKTKEPEFNPDGKIFGRSFYICKDNFCLEKVLKAKQPAKYTKLQVPQKVIEDILQVINFKKN